MVSGDHFSVDGTLVEAWASVKSFHRKDDDSGDNNAFGGFKVEKRRNSTHKSKTDPESKLSKKGCGREAKMPYMGHALMENQSGVMVDFELTEANGKAERQAVVQRLSHQDGSHGLQVADQGTDRLVVVPVPHREGMKAVPHVLWFEDGVGVEPDHGLRAARSNPSRQPHQPSGGPRSSGPRRAARPGASGSPA